MKRLIFTTICTLLSLSALSADPFDYYQVDFAEDDNDEYCEIDYIKLGGGLLTLGQDSTFVPIIGFGRRYECPEMGVDYSVKFGYAKGIAGNDRSVFVYTAPKILALRYLDPCSNFSVYYGGGASWSGIVNNNKSQTFHGVFLEAALGYELQRRGSVRTFIQLDMNQAVLAAYRKGKFPTPSLELTFGMGF